MALKLSSPTPLMNAVGREVAFDVATGDYVVELFEHTPGVANVAPDYLSRVHAPEAERKPSPPVLVGVPVLPVPRRGEEWWRTMKLPTPPNPE